ncbi:MAG TPA: hypothetical protein VLC73_16970 [Burkholderiales bacterium]|nr:hypothetical protein [Burkholderiales bacterium]
MPYFDVQINGAAVACAGADDIQVLSAYVIIAPHGEASLGIHGMRLTDAGMEEHLSWKTPRVHRGDRIEITYVLIGKATVSNSYLAPAVEPETLVAELKKMGAELEARFRDTFPDGISPLKRLPEPIVLRVSAAGSSAVDAKLGNEEQLQAVLNATARDCVLEVDSLTVLESGNTKGQRWLRQQVSPGQRIEMIYAT